MHAFEIAGEVEEPDLDAAHFGFGAVDGECDLDAIEGLCVIGEAGELEPIECRIVGGKAGKCEARGIPDGTLRKELDRTPAQVATFVDKDTLNVLLVHGAMGESEQEPIVGERRIVNGLCAHGEAKATMERERQRTFIARPDMSTRQRVERKGEAGEKEEQAFHIKLEQG